MDCSANATPSFEGRGGESLATSISGVLSRAYSSPEVMDLKKLVVLPGNTCWILYVDILVLELGGNIYDAVSIAVKAALATTRIRHVHLQVFWSTQSHRNLNFRNPTTS